MCMALALWPHSIMPMRPHRVESLPVERRSSMAEPVAAHLTKSQARLLRLPQRLHPRLDRFMSPDGGYFHYDATIRLHIGRNKIQYHALAIWTVDDCDRPKLC